MQKIFVRGLLVAVMTTLSSWAWAQDVVPKNDNLEKRVEALEKRVAELEKLLKPVRKSLTKQAVREAEQKLARARMQKDRYQYTSAQLVEIEKLYQVANKKWNSMEAMDNIQKLLKDYPKANRTGCGLLYLAQVSKGADRLALLNKAIKDYGDCRYGDGVQVGAYAKFLLILHHAEAKEKEIAAELAKELKKNSPTAIDHQGNLLADMLPELK